MANSSHVSWLQQCYTTQKCLPIICTYHCRQDMACRRLGYRILVYGLKPRHAWCLWQKRLPFPSDLIFSRPAVLPMYCLFIPTICSLPTAKTSHSQLFVISLIPFQFIPNDTTDTARITGVNTGGARGGMQSVYTSQDPGIFSFSG